MLERFPTVFELALGPLCVLGAGLLGVASARWLPWGLQTTGWAMAHLRWSVVLSVALAGLAWASRDPAWRRRSARPSSMATRP
ncbi:hypothetical protein Aple_056430 [Acrocarpospora pleiomorpha]|uniref:Uncharacterized protein n=1 Tax=Acrocarpospora pleiomorpha TaxID=90975 RepID=A0A5M3XNE9_9ACTN|nr:hypothetical protein Aple_056430 [Acrocarpospora pleiomorpha]